VSFRDANPNMAISLPANTLLFRAEGPQVGVVSPDGHVELHSILVGRDLGQSLEVISGVTTNDRVIINPSDSLVTGAQVRIADAAPDPMTGK
jgi:hypothetical protein